MPGPAIAAIDWSAHDECSVVQLSGQYASTVAHRRWDEERARKRERESEIKRESKRV